MDTECSITILSTSGEVQLTEWSDDDAELIWQLPEVQPDMAVLYVPCGHGRSTNLLVARGVRMTGLDPTPAVLEPARKDAVDCGVHVAYVEGGMRRLKWPEAFD